MDPSPEDLSESFSEVLGPKWTEDLPNLLPAEAASEAPTGASTEATPEEPAVPPSATRIIEALLFVGGPALTLPRALKIVRGLTDEQFHAAVEELNRAYRVQNRPYVILPQDQGFVLALRPKYLPLHEKLYGGIREARLSTGAVDVLALVAYRQPTSKVEIDNLRGAESGGILKQLVRRGLIQVIGRGDSHHTEVLYGTTPRFLELFGLQSLDDLPKTQELPGM